MKTLIDWFLIFILMYIIDGITNRFLENLRPGGFDWRKIERENLGILYYYPENKG